MTIKKLSKDMPSLSHYIQAVSKWQSEKATHRAFGDSLSLFTGLSGYPYFSQRYLYLSQLGYLKINLLHLYSHRPLKYPLHRKHRYRCLKINSSSSNYWVSQRYTKNKTLNNPNFRDKDLNRNNCLTMKEYLLGLRKNSQRKRYQPRRTGINLRQYKTTWRCCGNHSAVYSLLRAFDYSHFLPERHCLVSGFG